MEEGSSSSLGVKAPPLNSDQLNYLIWRYLQESGYGEAAVKLQRDWNVNAESLNFAKYIKGQALISLVQKGLRYHHLSLTIDENGRPSKQLNPSMFFFGPESDRQQSEPQETIARPTSSHRAPSPENVTPGPKKHPREAVPNGTLELGAQPASKKTRKTGATASTERNGTPGRKPSNQAPGPLASSMEIDAVNGHPMPVQEARSPSATEAGLDEGEPIMNGVHLDERMDIDTDIDIPPPVIIDALPPIIHTTGQSIGVQVTPAKVANLSPSTIILDLPTEKNITETLWRPQDNNVLTASGEDFCGVWKTLDPTTQDKPKFQHLIGDNEVFNVSAVAWEPNGAMLAIATYSDQSGQLHLYDGQDLALLEILPASQRAISCLRWQKSGLRLVGLAPYDDQNAGTAGSSSILLWDLLGAQADAGPRSIAVPEKLLAVDCAFFDNEGIACAAGEHAVYQCRAFSELEVEQKWSSQTDGIDQWAFVKCAWRGTTDAFIVTASIEARIWLPTNDIMKHDAHEAEITGLQIRPQPSAGPNALSITEFATSSADATIKVWRYDEVSSSLSTVCKLTLGYALPIMSISYSPDGFCLAGASYGNVRIWNAEHGYNQMAGWHGAEDQWRGDSLIEDDLKSTGGMSSVNGDNPRSSADHSLSWDVNSKKLAFALGSQVALINFQR